MDTRTLIPPPTMLSNDDTQAAIVLFQRIVKEAESGAAALQNRRGGPGGPLGPVAPRGPSIPDTPTRGIGVGTSAENTTVGTSVSPVMAPVSASQAAPPPLSPEAFTNSGAGNTASIAGSTAPTTTTEGMLTDIERATLQSALTLFKAARKDAASADPNVSGSGKRQMASVLCYLVGFFDSRGLMNNLPSVKPGFTAVFGDAQPDPNAVFDLLEARMEQALTAVATRSRKEILDAMGDILLAAAAIIIAL